MNINEILFGGNVGADAQLVTTKSGKDHVKFNVAYNQKGSGDYPDETTWMPIVAYGGWVRLAQTIKKGDKVTVRGRLLNRTYKDSNTGADKQWTAIMVQCLSIEAKQGAVASGGVSEGPIAQEPMSASQPWDEIPF